MHILRKFLFKINFGQLGYVKKKKKKKRNPCIYYVIYRNASGAPVGSIGSFLVHF